MSETKLIDIKELKFDEHNFNRHNDEGMSLLEKSIKENGLGRSILLDKDNNIVGGNGVTEKAIELGKTKVRIIETDGTELIAVKRTDLTLDSERGRKMALADNSVAHANLEWNKEELQKAQDDWGLVPEEWGVELPDMGLPDELAGDSKTTEYTDVKDDDFDPDAKFEAKVKAGEVWQLGDHRLMCGDSTDADAVAKLMNGERADMVLSDPPYGMKLDTDFSSIKGSLNSIGRKNHTEGNKYERVIGDNDDFTPALITTFFDNFGYCHEMFLFGADYFAEILPNKNDGSWLVWDKRKESQADAIGAEFELIWSRKKHKRRMLRHDWFGFLSSQNGADARNRVHPTQKPITLLADIIQQWGDKANIIVDLYGGSGSTMIACEQLGRKCRMMELDPHYCDVIIARWEKLTGNKAEKMEN